MPILADTQQTDEMVNRHIPILELAGQISLRELRDRHADRSLGFALQVRLVLLVGQLDHGRPGSCLSYLHNPSLSRVPRSRKPCKTRVESPSTSRMSLPVRWFGPVPGPLLERPPWVLNRTPTFKIRVDWDGKACSW